MWESQRQNKTHVQVAVRTEMGIDSTLRLKQTIVSRGVTKWHNTHVLHFQGNTWTCVFFFCRVMVVVPWCVNVVVPGKLWASSAGVLDADSMAFQGSMYEWRTILTGSDTLWTTDTKWQICHNLNSVMDFYASQCITKWKMTLRIIFIVLHDETRQMYKVTNSELRILICDKWKEFVVDEALEPHNKTITVTVGPCSTSANQQNHMAEQFIKKLINLQNQ